MINVYISKSNNANLDDITAVRNQLDRHSGLRILEHTGGKYDESLIKKANLIIMIPAKPNIKTAIVGKGLYSQATATNAMKMIYCGGRGYFTLESIHITDETNWNKYAKLIFGNVKFRLDEVLKVTNADKLMSMEKGGVKPSPTVEKREAEAVPKKRDYRQLL